MFFLKSLVLRLLIIVISIIFVFITKIIEGLPPMPPTPNRGHSKVGCGRSKQCLGDGRQVSGILQPFSVDAQPSGSIPTSQQQTDGQSCHPKNTKQPKVVESAAFQIVHDDATRI